MAAGSDTIWANHDILAVMLQSCLVFLNWKLFAFPLLVAVAVFSPILKRSRIYCVESRFWWCFWKLRVFKNIFWKNISFITDFFYLLKKIYYLNRVKKLAIKYWDFFILTLILRLFKHVLFLKLINFYSLRITIYIS